MSYIDTFDHEFVGWFGYLPVYHPLEVVVGDQSHPADFGCDPTNLVLGGGSGEHPGLILRRPDYAVGCYVDDLLEGLRANSPEDAAAFAPQAERWETFLEKSLIAARDDILYFVDWSVSRYHDFYEMCCSSMLRSPYNPDKDESWFERWLAATLGEFVIFSMPELVPNLEDVLPDVQLLVQLPLDSQPNILIPPPGYPSPLGRKLVENEVRWGYSRWWH